MLDRGCLYLPVTPFLALQLGEAHIERSGYPVEVSDTDVALAPLDAAHVGPVRLAAWANASWL
jgi:hypothetical protein